MKAFCQILLVLVSPFARAVEFSPVEKTYIGQGNLVTVRMTVADGQARIFLIGKEAARLDFKDPAQLLKVTAFVDDKQKQELRFSQEGDYYVTTIPQKPNLTLSVSTKLGKTKEDVRVKLEDKP